MAKKKGKKHIDVNPGVQFTGRWIVYTPTGGSYTVNADGLTVVSETLVFTANNQIIFTVPNHAYARAQKV